MSSITRFLQESFVRQCPPGWRALPEQPLVDRDGALRLGFEPRADVLLEQLESGRRVWVEFEVSRADPVANHAKFATARFLEEQGRDDTFVSMASSHIAPGRLALAAGAAMLMRGFGIPAFQTLLLPQAGAQDVRRLNQGPMEAVALFPGISPKKEIERVLAVSDANLVPGGHRIHKADNPWAVAVNVRQWNAEVRQPRMAQLWRRRRVSYLAWDPISGLFAPSKFCAFVPTASAAHAAQLPAVLGGRPAGMTMPVYSVLGEGDPRFDGRIAWLHLQNALGYRKLAEDELGPEMLEQLGRWAGAVEAWVQLLRPLYVLVPPARRR